MMAELFTKCRVQLTKYAPSRVEALCDGLSFAEKEKKMARDMGNPSTTNTRKMAFQRCCRDRLHMRVPT